jgi:hypothetical protein
MPKLLISALLCAGVAVAAGPAFAQAAPTAPTSAAPSLDPFEQVMAARSVADYARRTKDVQAMIVAARMLQEVPVVESAPAAGAAATAENEAGAFTAEGLFEEAKGLAKNDPTLLAQIRLAQSSGRGVLSSAFGRGLVRIVQNMGARASYVFPITAKGGERLRIGAIGAANTKMVMRMRDGRGKVVCTDDSGDYAPVCSLDSPAAGDYRVEVLNRSDAPSRTVILSN